MQSRTLTLFALVVQASSVLLSETSARQWLRNHPAPQGDDLAELKTANPEAYAIVKALLTKRSLGLLDPKHPSASFVKAAPADAVPSGPEVFQNMAGPSASKSHAEEYPDVPVASTHHDWLNWKPKESAADDESMVNSVLGAVANLKAGGNLRGNSGETSKGGASVSSDADASLEWSNNVVVTTSMAAKQAPLEQPASPVAEQGNSYLKAVDFGMPVPTRTPASGENSYLKSADLAVTTKQPTQDSTNYLATFSWDDTKVAPAKQEAPTAPPPVRKDNALLSWLGGSSTVKAAVVTQAPTPVQPENPYLAALN